MLTVETRLLTPEERDRVAGYLRYARKQTRLGWWPGCSGLFIMLVGGATVGLLASGLLMSVVAWLLERLGLPTPVLRPVILVFLVTGPVIGFLAGFRLLWKDITGDLADMSAYRHALELDLAENRAEFLHCTVADAAQVEGLEDFGPGYFLDVDDSTLLYVQGQNLDELEDEGRFPNREFRIVQTPHAKICFQFECIGETFEPSRMVDCFNSEVYLPEDGEILPGRLDSLEADLRRIEQQRQRRS